MNIDIAVLSDIHGNYIALKSCMDYALARGIYRFIFLGDYVGELAYPERTMQMIYDIRNRYECYFIKGNKEDYWLDYQSNGEKGWKDYDSTTGSLSYAYRHLTEKDLDFFRELQPAQIITICDMPSITICHGSPRKLTEKLLPGDSRTYEIMASTNSDVILCGHTHIQNKIEHCGKIVLNPGSVGVPLNSDGKAQFLILHGKNQAWAEEFISLEYNVSQAIEELRESGLDKYAPYWCRVTANLLRRGTPSHNTVLIRAMALCVAETGTCVWPDIPEQCWKQAVEEMLPVSISETYTEKNSKTDRSNTDDLQNH